MRYLLTLALLSLASVASAQWTFVDSLRVGGIASASLLAVDSSDQLLVYSNGLLIHDPVTGRWTHGALPEASKPFMAVLPGGRILAAYNKAVYYSDDSCRTWSALGRGFDVSNISGILWNDTTILVVGLSPTTGMMVLNTSDSNWQAVESSLPIKNFTAAQHTRDGYFIVANGRWIYRTTDPMHWDITDSAKTDAKVTRSVILGNGDILALAQFSSSVYYSQDWGDTWSQPLSIAGLNSLRSLIAVTNGIAVATTPDDGFYLTMDYAETWKHVHALPVLLVNGLSSIADTDIVVASGSGIYRSVDSGASWREMDSAWTTTTATAIGAIGDTAFLSVTLRGTYRSYAMPPQWIPADDSLFGGLNGYQVARGAMYGMTSSHLVRWSGAAWSALPNMFEDAQPITYAMSTSGRMFAATPTQFYYLTADHEWRTVTQLFGLLIKETVADSAGRVYALVGTDSILYSADDGENWSELPGRPTPVTVRAMMAAGDTLLVATGGGTGNALHATADLGEHWTNVPYALTAVNGMASYQGRHFVYNSSTLLERESQETSWTSTVSVPATAGILDVSISPNGRAYVLTSRGLYTRVLPSAVNAVGPELRESRALSVYPNPARSIATVRGQWPIDVIDINGRTIGTTSDGSLDCSHYPNGVYQLRTASGQRIKLLIAK